eukprot:6018978-Pyramimonas_sp.AAC.1
MADRSGEEGKAWSDGDRLGEDGRGDKPNRSNCGSSALLDALPAALPRRPACLSSPCLARTAMSRPGARRATRAA